MAFPVKEFLSVIKFPLLFLVICWSLFLLDNSFNLELYQYGVKPRTIDGLKGIVCSAFIHADLTHIFNNTFPILILGSMIFYFYNEIAWSSIFWIYIISGIWLWIGGRNNNVIPNYHFGASILIYGFSTFLFFSGVFRKHTRLMLVSAFVVFMYGSITWGILPIDEKVSWEGHLFGALSGVLVAYNYRKKGPQKIRFVWPAEEVDLEAEYEKDVEIEKKLKELAENNASQHIDIIYHYKSQHDTKDKPEL